MIADAHVHFFSAGFYRALAAVEPEGADGDTDAAVALPARLGWTPPGTDDQLADRWVSELDAHGVSRAMLIASVPGDHRSVSEAVRRHPSRFVGAFMHDPAAPAAEAELEAALGSGMRTICLFPAMHHVPIDDPRSVRVFAAAERRGCVVFVHCGVLSVGVRKRLGLPSPFDIRLGDPLAVAAMALRHPTVPVVIPHFGAGRFAEALMAASQASNVVFDTSSSNAWTSFHSGLTLRDVFARALDVVGPARLLFGSDSSFFPRGWQKGIYEQQRQILADLDVGPADAQAIFSGNFSRIFRE